MKLLTARKSSEDFKGDPSAGSLMLSRSKSSCERRQTVFMPPCSNNLSFKPFFLSLQEQVRLLHVFHQRVGLYHLAGLVREEFARLFEYLLLKLLKAIRRRSGDLVIRQECVDRHNFLEHILVYRLILSILQQF